MLALEEGTEEARDVLYSLRPRDVQGSLHAAVRWAAAINEAALLLETVQPWSLYSFERALEDQRISQLRAVRSLIEAPITTGSDFRQLVDGQHRLLAMYVQGVSRVLAVVL